MTKEIIGIALAIFSIAILIGSRLVRNKANKELVEARKSKTK